MLSLIFSLILLYTPETYNGLVKCLHYIHLNMGLRSTTTTLFGKWSPLYAFHYLKRILLKYPLHSIGLLPSFLWYY